MCERELEWFNLFLFSFLSDESLQEFSMFLKNLEDQRELMVRTTSQNLLESQGKYLSVCVSVCLSLCVCVCVCVWCIVLKLFNFTMLVRLLFSNLLTSSPYLLLPIFGTQASINVWLRHSAGIQTDSRNIIFSTVHYSAATASSALVLMVSESLLPLYLSKGHSHSNCLGVATERTGVHSYVITPKL